MSEHEYVPMSKDKLTHFQATINYPVGVWGTELRSSEELYSILMIELQGTLVSGH